MLCESEFTNQQCPQLLLTLECNNTLEKHEHPIHMEELCDRFSLVQSALAYLDNTDHLYYVKTTCCKYSSGEELLVYHFKLDVDPAELTELNAALGNFVLLKPLKATEIFQEIVFQTAQELELLPSDTTLSQISVFLKLASLPSPLEGIKCMKDLSRNIGSCNYVKFDGVVTGVTGISKYTRSTRYVCPHPACEGNEGHKFIRVHIAGASETQTIRKDFRCSACGSVLEEDKSSRIISDKLLAEVVHEDCFHDVINAKTRQRVQAVPVYVRDELCEKIQIGQKYQIIGMVRKDITGEVVNLALEANNIIEISHIVHPLTPSFLPESLVCLYSDRRDSPWSFSLSLAYVFGGEIAPPGSYLQLKLGLMLSLATVSEEKPLHILGIGSEVETIQRLMDYGRQFCDRSVCHMAGCHLTGKVISDRHETAPYFIEGGSLLLAAGGVCFLGELGRLKKKVQEHLQAVLGSTKVYLELGSKHTGGLPQRTVQPLPCQIWGYSDSKPNKGKTSDDLFSHQDSGIIPKPMLDGFGCVCYTDIDDTVSREEIDTLAACQILVQSMESQQRDNRLPVSSHDFRQFFQYLSSYRTKMTSEALHLLQMYYQASRKARACSDASTGVPVTAMQTLMDAVAAADELRCLLISHNTATRQLQSLDNEISRLTSKLETLPTACHLPLTQRVSALEGVRRMFSVFCSLKWQEVQAYVGEISSSLDEQHMDLDADVSFEEDVRDGHQVTWTSCVSHRGQ